MTQVLSKNLEIDLRSYVSSSAIVLAAAKRTGHLSRCGKVKRAPTLDEYDKTEAYNHSDDPYFEERR